MLRRYFTFFAVAIIILIAVICYAVLGAAFSSQASDRINAVGKEISQIVSYSRDRRAVTHAVRRYELSDGMYTFVITPDGEPVVPVDYVKSDDWESIKNGVFSNMHEWVSGESLVYSSSGTLNYVSAVVFEGAPHFLLVRYPLSIVTQTVHRMQIYVLITALVVLVVAFFISYTVSDKLARPLENVAGSATRLAKGDYSVRFESAEYQEIAKLSDTLNYVTDEIKKSDKFQKDLLANVSHDFKTPLTMIKAYASMIQEISGDDPEKRNKHLQVIIDEADRLTGLVNDVLAASKASAGLGNINKKVFNLTEFVYGILNKFGYLQETQGYKFMTDIENNLYTVADEEKIGQVVYNLLSNAVNYTGEDKTVYISLKYSAAENRIKFSVRDTGKGISEEELEHIWDRYYRSKDEHARPVKGTGLGLNIVKAILVAHNFNFGVNSEKGAGSTFFVDFPKVSSTPEVVTDNQ